MTYYDSCPECDSLNVRVREEDRDAGGFMVICDDCGLEYWDDDTWIDSDSADW